MTDIQVTCERSAPGWRCRVRVADDGRHAEFDVTARDPSRFLPADRATMGVDADVERLVSETFVFLLEREPVSSVLPSFDLDVVGRYFPEYRAEILRRLGGGSP
jgi:hypothetical protein